MDCYKGSVIIRFSFNLNGHLINNFQALEEEQR